jgi:hypothetical protein
MDEERKDEVEGHAFMNDERKDAFRDAFRNDEPGDDEVEGHAFRNLEKDDEADERSAF